MERKKPLQNVAEFLKSDKGSKVLLIGGAVGILLLALPEILPQKENAKNSTVESAADVFVQQTEERLGSLLAGIEGAGECRIMITLENGVEYVYATEQKTNTNRQEDNNDDSTRLTQQDDSEESVIVVDNGEGREGLLVTEIQPTVKGVVVVCAGGDNAEVQERIVQAVTVALNISSKRVCVTKLS